MGKPKRIDATAGRHSLVDTIPFTLPVRGAKSPVFFAVFPISAKKAAPLLPGNEVHPVRLWGDKGLLVVTVIDYRETNIGKYIEYSIGIACTFGEKPAPPLLPGLFMKKYGTGQFIFDLPVSTDVSVKGGKGIWGMPKHRASLNYVITDAKVSSQYDLDGQLGTYVEIERPRSVKKDFETGSFHWGGPYGIALNLCFAVGAVNYAAFRGMLFRSFIYFQGDIAFAIGKHARGRLVVGDLPRHGPLKELDGDYDNPLFTAYIPEMTGVLDDHCESWFLSTATAPAPAMEGMESVVDLPRAEVWPPPPTAPVPGVPDAPHPTTSVVDET